MAHAKGFALIQRNPLEIFKTGRLGVETGRYPDPVLAETDHSRK